MFFFSKNCILHTHTHIYAVTSYSYALFFRRRLSGQVSRMPVNVFDQITIGTSSCNIVHDFFPFLRVYSDGRIERFMGKDVCPASAHPESEVQSKDVTISREPNVSARLYKPRNAQQGNKRPLLVYFHGGAFMIESAYSPMFHNYLNSLAKEAKVIVVSVEYRLAPEYRIPTAYEDSWLALKWIASHSKGEGSNAWLKDHADLDRVYFGGDSAGGNIAHNMAMRVGLEKLSGLNLVGMFLNCPYFWGKEPIGNEVAIMNLKKFFDSLWPFLYPITSGLDDPLLNPAMDLNLSRLGCNRVLVYVAENDVLKDRGRHYKEALEKCGWTGELEIVEVEGEYHIFNLLLPNQENSIAMLRNIASFLNGN